MDEFEKFKRKFLRKEYKFIRTYKKDFGERIIAEHKSGWLRTDKRALICHFTRKPTVKDLGRFVKDFEKFIDQFESNYDVVGGYLVTHGAYDKEGFKLFLERVDEEIRKYIMIVSLKEEKPKKTERKVKPSKVAPTHLKPSELKQILRKIKGFKPYKRPRKEKELETMLVSRLGAYYPEIRTQLTYERARIDAQIGKVGIEIKYQPSAGEFDRLYGQIDKYLRHLDFVIVIIGYPKSTEGTRFFKKRLKERGWLNKRVFVVTI